LPLFKTITNYLTSIRAEAEDAHNRPEPQQSCTYDPPGSPAWIGVDLDGTLACWEPGNYPDHIGPPVAVMMDQVRQMLADGWRVKIFTARAADPEQLVLIQQWLRSHGLPPLEITNAKDFNMVRLYDDRCVQVEPNTGRIIGGDDPQQKDENDK
jgi:hypothetical protein